MTGRMSGSDKEHRKVCKKEYLESRKEDKQRAKRTAKSIRRYGIANRRMKGKK